MKTESIWRKVSKRLLTTGLKIKKFWMNKGKACRKLKNKVRKLKIKKQLLMDNSWKDNRS
jgi:hypothetical protein